MAKRKTKTGPEISIVHIAAKADSKTISASSLKVYRKGYIVWEITNAQRSGNLTVDIGEFVAQKRGSPRDPVMTTGPVTLAPGESGQINGTVHGLGSGNLKYTYNVYINNLSVDPEIVVCDDPDPVPLVRKKAARKTAAKKAAKKRTAKK